MLNLILSLLILMSPLFAHNSSLENYYSSLKEQIEDPLKSFEEKTKGLMAHFSLTYENSHLKRFNDFIKKNDAVLLENYIQLINEDTLVSHFKALRHINLEDKKLNKLQKAIFERFYYLASSDRFPSHIKALSLVMISQGGYQKYFLERKISISLLMNNMFDDLITAFTKKEIAKEASYVLELLVNLNLFTETQILELGENYSSFQEKIEELQNELSQEKSTTTTKESIDSLYHSLASFLFQITPKKSTEKVWATQEGQLKNLEFKNSQNAQNFNLDDRSLGPDIDLKSFTLDSIALDMKTSKALRLDQYIRIAGLLIKKKETAESSLFLQTIYNLIFSQATELSQKVTLYDLMAQYEEKVQNKNAPVSFQTPILVKFMNTIILGQIKTVGLKGLADFEHFIKTFKDKNHLIYFLAQPSTLKFLSDFMFYLPQANTLTKDIKSLTKLLYPLIGISVSLNHNKNPMSLSQEQLFCIGLGAILGVARIPLMIYGYKLFSEILEAFKQADIPFLAENLFQNSSFKKTSIDDLLFLGRLDASLFIKNLSLYGVFSDSKKDSSKNLTLSLNEDRQRIKNLLFSQNVNINASKGHNTLFERIIYLIVHKKDSLTFLMNLWNDLCEKEILHMDNSEDIFLFFKPIVKNAISLFVMQDYFFELYIKFVNHFDAHPLFLENTMQLFRIISTSSRSIQAGNTKNLLKLYQETLALILKNKDAKTLHITLDQEFKNLIVSKVKRNESMQELLPRLQASGFNLVNETLISFRENAKKTNSGQKTSEVSCMARVGKYVTGLFSKVDL